VGRFSEQVWGVSHERHHWSRSGRPLIGHVLGFKGLEHPVVMLAVNGFRDESRAREMLYVGLSRARTQFVVCGDPELIASVGGEAARRRLTA
jgi:UvrD-like helicase C-terminal domain